MQLFTEGVMTVCYFKPFPPIIVHGMFVNFVSEAELPLSLEVV